MTDKNYYYFIDFINFSFFGIFLNSTFTYLPPSISNKSYELILSNVFRFKATTPLLKSIFKSSN